MLQWKSGAGDTKTSKILQWVKGLLTNPLTHCIKTENTTRRPRLWVLAKKLVCSSKNNQENTAVFISRTRKNIKLRDDEGNSLWNQYFGR